MKRKRFLLFAACLILIAGGGFVARRTFFPRNAPRWYLNSSEQELKARYGRTYLRAYCLGATAAAEDLIANKAVFVTTGDISEHFDQETGLTMLSLGGDADKGMFGYAAGYNRIVGAFIRLRGIPSNSRKPWQQILSHLNEYYDSRAGSEPALQLALDAKPTRMPDGRQVSFTSELNINHRVVWYNLKLGDVLYPLLTFYPHSDGTMQLYSGPPGSDLLILRGGDGGQFTRPFIEHNTQTIALDLRLGVILGQAEKPNN